MDSIVGEELLRGLAARAESPAWLSLWRAVSFLGHPTFFTIAIPALFAWVSWSLARRFSAGFLVAAYLSSTLKAAVGRARLDVADFGLAAPLEATRTFDGAAFPSGHALIATVVWGTTALWWSRRTKSSAGATAILLGSALLVGAIAFSRLALLRHDILDVAAGLALGGVLLALLQLLDRTWIPRLGALPWEEQAGLWVLLALVAQLSAGLAATAVALGLLAGLGSGAAFATARRRVATPTALQGFLRLLLMVAGAFAARWIAGRWFPDAALPLLFAFFGAGVWIAGLVPRWLGGALDAPGPDPLSASADPNMAQGD